MVRSFVVKGRSQAASNASCERPAVGSLDKSVEPLPYMVDNFSISALHLAIKVPYFSNSGHKNEKVTNYLSEHDIVETAYPTRARRVSHAAIRRIASSETIFARWLGFYHRVDRVILTTFVHHFRDLSHSPCAVFFWWLRAHPFWQSRVPLSSKLHDCVI
eukprot:SAG31_NODE_1986_length_6725_cov_3.779505_6_plen_160_part_00